MKVLRKVKQNTRSVLLTVREVARTLCGRLRLHRRKSSSLGSDCVEAPSTSWQQFEDHTLDAVDGIGTAAPQAPFQRYAPGSNSSDIDDCQDGCCEDAEPQTTVPGPAADERSSAFETTYGGHSDTGTASPPKGCWETWDCGGVDETFADGDPLWLPDGRAPSCSSEEDLDVDFETETVYLFERQSSSKASSVGDLDASDGRKCHSRYLAPRMSERDDVGVLLEKRSINPPRVPYPLHKEMRGMFAQPFDVPPNDQLDEKLPDLYAAPVYEDVIRPFLKYDDDTMQYKYDSDNDPEDDMDVLMVSVPCGYTLVELTDDMRHASPSKKREVYDFMRMSV